MRVLVAIEDDYRSYREVIAASLRVLRPQVETQVATPDVLGESIAQFGPDVVICSRLGASQAHAGPAWVELPVDPMRPARVRLAGHFSERPNPTMEMLVAVVDQAERTSQG